MELIYNVFYVFFGVIEVIVLAYLLISLFSKSNWLHKKLTDIVNPLFEPVRYLLSYSIFKSNIEDFSPIITFLVVNYLQQFFYVLM